MAKRDWKQYNDRLIQRGSLAFLIDPKIFKVKKTKCPGRPKLFSDALITMLMLTKIHHHMTYRSLQGFARSLISISNQPHLIPTYTAICKRARKLKLPKLSSKRPKVVAIDGSGVKVYGEGEWKVKVHGKSKRRKWIKVHIAVDPKTGEIVAETTTKSDVHDSTVIDVILGQVSGSCKQVLADGSYDGCRAKIYARGATALVPPPKNARIHNKDPARDDAVRIIRCLGRSLWGKLSGYSRRSLVESAFSRMKRLFGSRLFSKRFDAQKVENRLRCLLLNLFNRGEKNTFGDFVLS